MTKGISSSSTISSSKLGSWIGLGGDFEAAVDVVGCFSLFGDVTFFGDILGWLEIEALVVVTLVLGPLFFTGWLKLDGNIGIFVLTVGLRTVAFFAFMFAIVAVKAATWSLKVFTMAFNSTQEVHS